jgi:hypothetical protein
MGRQHRFRHVQLLCTHPDRLPGSDLETIQYGSIGG